MITFNSDRGLVNIDNWQDVISLPGYQKNLNPDEHILDSIIGRYIEKDMIPCGLSNCHSLHAKGYVAKTKSGLVTNIGKDCGKKYFGVDFEVMTKNFERDIAIQTNKNTLASFSVRIEEFEQEITILREGDRGADWIYKKSRPLITMGKGCPASVVRTVNEMLKSSSSTLVKPREADENELAVAEQVQNRKIPKPYFINESVAEIQGLRSLTNEYDLREIFVLDINDGIEKFKKINIDNLTYNELIIWSKWIVSLDKKLEIATESINHGLRLLTKSNLEPFEQLLSDQKEKVEFKNYLKTLVH